jgi:hypothetical protein
MVGFAGHLFENVKVAMNTFFHTRFLFTGLVLVLQIDASSEANVAGIADGMGFFS